MGKSMADVNETRLNRIEDKIDKLTDAMVLIARTDEKLISMEQKYAAQYDRMNRFSQKLDDIEKLVETNNHTVMLINKVVGGIAIAAIGAWATQYFM
jgi:tetrahydromethanopterin S-methyltransferase subunit G